MNISKLSYAVLALIALLCVAIYANPAHADSTQLCSATVASAQSVAGANGYTTTVSSASAIKPGACPTEQPPQTVPNCAPWLAADLPGLTAACQGNFKRHASGPTTTADAGVWTFDKVFGPWPGNHFGWDAIFDSLGQGHYISIPFKPTPGHSVSFFINTTYTSSRQNVFSISTKQGVFSDGPSTICNGASNVNLTVSSNGRAGVGCVLNPNTVYWLNMAAGTVQPRQPISAATYVPCTVGAGCIVAVQEQFQN